MPSTDATLSSELLDEEQELKQDIDSSRQTTERYTVLADYLERIHEEYQNKEWPRTMCSKCVTSRHVYCHDCALLVIPEEDWPDSVRNHTLQTCLPFQLDILLDDRRSASSGVQMAALFHHAAAEPADDATNSQHQQPSPVVRFVELDRGQSIPDYGEDEDSIKTVLLYPGPGSIPLSSLLEGKAADTTLRLVALDCKWRNSVRRAEKLSSLTMVHLDNPPSQSHYWRWHNAGPGCLSTAEAVFWAAWQLVSGDGMSAASNCSSRREDNEQRLLDIMWLFAVQRSIILRRFHAEVRERVIPHLPFTDEAKEIARGYRRKQNHVRQQN
ncbi:hypothetical protein ACA910_017009 [Epithemia clementina (nom. ined.)]